MKRSIQRPWGRRQSGGWVIQNSQLLEALKQGNAIQLDNVTVGTAQFGRLISLLPYEDSLIRANGRLEVETIERVPNKCKDGVYRCSFRKPKHYRQFFAILDRAWVPRVVNTLVVLKPRKF